MHKFLEITIKDVTEINKTFKPIWEFIYKISGEEARVKLVKRNPDNLLVSGFLAKGSIVKPKS